MKKNYYVNDRAQSNGDHEVHVQGCIYMPVNKTYLGDHENCVTAVAIAKVHHKQVNGCVYCCTPCHTR